MNAVFSGSLLPLETPSSMLDHISFFAPSLSFALCVLSLFEEVGIVDSLRAADAMMASCVCCNDGERMATENGGISEHCRHQLVRIYQFSHWHRVSENALYMAKLSSGSP